MPGLHSACTGSDAVVDDVGKVPEELHDAPGEHNLGPDVGAFCNYHLKSILSSSLGKKMITMFKLKV